MTRRKRQRFCFVFVTMLSLAAPAVPLASSEAPSTCPVTRRPEPAFIPPGPYPTTPPGTPNVFWHGTSGLWTMLDANGVFTGLTGPSPHLPGVITTRNKSFWWSPGYHPMWTPEPRLKIERRRLDGDAPKLAEPWVTNAHVDTFGGWTMLTMLEFATPGCWEVTGSYGADSISFVVWVESVKVQK